MHVQSMEDEDERLSMQDTTPTFNELYKQNKGW